MPPVTRSKTVSINRSMATHPTMATFKEEIKNKKSQLRPTVSRPSAVRKSRIPRVSLKNANERILPPAPPVVDPLREVIAQIQEKSRALKKVDVRTENGIVIID